MHTVHPNVSVTGLNSRPTIGEPFSLECSITVDYWQCGCYMDSEWDGNKKSKQYSGAYYWLTGNVTQ